MKPSTAQEQLWRELAYLFEEDDGSLPEVRFLDIPPGGSARMLEELRRRAEPLEHTTTIWHPELEREIPLNDAPDMGALFAKGGFPAVLRGIRSHGVRLPELGLWVDSAQVEFNYRMGSEWNAEVLAAFVELLSDLRRLAPGARFDLEEGVLESVREHFRRSVEAYLAFDNG
jgi:hypothetical protein